MMKKYGVAHPLQVGSAREKFQSTCEKKYGETHFFKAPDVRKKIKETNLERYGVENVFESEEIKLKIKETCLEKYGVENPGKSEVVKQKRKETCLKKYGETHYFKTEEAKRLYGKVRCLAMRKAFFRKYGKRSPFGLRSVQVKSNQTIYNKLGIEADPEIHWSKNQTALRVTQLASYQRHPTYGIYLQGYESKVLEEILGEGLNFEDFQWEEIPSFQYWCPVRNKIRTYHPDFFIPHLNWIIEVKSVYTFLLEKETNLAKRGAVIQAGYRFNFILKD